MAELRILVDVVLPDGTIRLWNGSGGPFVDGDGNTYKPAQFTEDALQQIQSTINWEAFTLSLALISIPTATADQVWDYDEETPVNGAPVIIKLLEIGNDGQPGEADVVFTGELDNLTVTDDADDDQQRSVIVVECRNSSSLRTITNGAVLSDVDQKARSALLNPTAPPDRFAERVPGLRDKTIRWPNW